MLKSIVGSQSKARILTFIAARTEGYAGEIINFWKCPSRPIKRELNILEADGILSSKPYGRTIIYKFNDRFYLKNELLALINKAIRAFSPEEKERLLYNRKRPRAKGKPVKYLKDFEAKTNT